MLLCGSLGTPSTHSPAAVPSRPCPMEGSRRGRDSKVWTPALVTGALAGLIWAGAPHTGASMNPARTLGPDLATGEFPVLWAYVAGPLAGATLAAGLFSMVARERRTLTAKLYHDPDYPSVHATTLPARPHRGTNQTRPPATGRP